MGITGFNKWIKNNYDIQSKSSSIYHNIMIDFNHILHGNIKKNMTFDEYYDSIKYSVLTLFNNYIATNKIIIAIDGIPPQSKIELQKTRRNEIKYDLNYISPIHITPGTKFMQDIKIFLILLFNDIKKNYKIVNPEIIIDCSDNIHEGEIKLLKYLLQSENEKNLIIGNDADLMILSVCCKKISDIDLLIKTSSAKYIININDILINHALKIDKSLSAYDKNFRSDFALISLLMGNDYLPKLRMATLDKLWGYYKNIYQLLKKPMVINDNFNMEFMFMFFNVYSQKHKKIIKLNENPKLYLEGLLWCLSIYQTGEYKNYDYVYNCDKSINSMTVYDYIFDLVLKKENVIVHENNNIIDINQYVNLVLPEYAIHSLK